jgi:hypothetical protein
VIFKNFFTESTKTLSEEFLHREPVGLLSTKNSSLRVFVWLLAKNFFTESFYLHREFSFTLVKSSLPRAQG